MQVQAAGRVRRKGKYRRSSALTDKTGPSGLSELELQSGILDSDLPSGTNEGSEGLTGAPTGTEDGTDVSWPGADLDACLCAAFKGTGC